MALESNRGPVAQVTTKISVYIDENPSFEATAECKLIQVQKEVSTFFPPKM